MHVVSGSLTHIKQLSDPHTNTRTQQEHTPSCSFGAATITKKRPINMQKQGRNKRSNRRSEALQTGCSIWVFLVFAFVYCLRKPVLNF